MAASPEIKRRIDSFLEKVFIMVTDELVENAAEWDQIEAWEQASWSMEWDQAMIDDLPELERRSVAGEMTADQSARYTRLLVILKESLPIIQRLDLQHLDIDVDAALARLQQATSTV